MLYVTSPELIRIVIGRLYLFITFMHFSHPYPSSRQPPTSFHLLLDSTYRWDHVMFIHSSVNRHLGWFHVLALVNDAAMSVEERYFKIVISFPLGIFPEVGLLDHMVILFFIVWGNSILNQPPIYNDFFSHNLDSWGAGIKRWTWEWHHSLLPLVNLSNIFAFSSLDRMVCWPRGLDARGRNASIWRRHNVSTELDATTATLLAALGSSFLWISRQRREKLCCQRYCSWLSGKIGLLHNGGEKGCRISLRAFLSIVMPCN